MYEMYKQAEVNMHFPKIFVLSYFKHIGLLTMTVIWQMYKTMVLYKSSLELRECLHVGVWMCPIKDQRQRWALATKRDIFFNASQLKW